MNIIKAIVIKTNTAYVNNDYCLFEVPGENSVFRFAEKELSGVADFSHNCSFITRGGIPDIVKICDFLESGNVVQSNDLTIRVKNTTQFDKFLSSNNISLLKNTVEFYTFVGTDSDSDSVGAFLDGTRTIESIEYTETEMIIKVKMSLSKYRNKRLSATLDEVNYPYVPESNKDKMIPIMFGASDPANGRYFKILQSTAQNDTLSIIDTVLYDEDKTYNPYSYKFPVILDSLDSKTARLLLGYAIDADDVVSNADTSYPDWFVGKFLFCIDGSTENQNKAREISTQFLTGEVMPDTRIFCEYELRDYLPNLPQGNSTFNDTDQAYFEIHDVDIKYIVSYYGILGFYDSITELAQSINYDLYGFINNDTIEKLMSSSFEYESANKILDINPRVFNNTSLTTLLNYDCYPADRIDKMVREDFDAIGNTGNDVLLPDLSSADGLNSPSSISATVSSVTVTGSYFNATDRQTGSGHRWINKFNTVSPINPHTSDEIIEVGYKITFPVLPDNYTFTKCYLGINLKTTSSSTSTTITTAVKARVYLQEPQEIVAPGTGSGVITTLNIDNLPDFYYLTDPATGNYNFFYEVANISGGQYNIRGHNGFEISATNIKDLRNIGWVGVVVSVLNPNSTYDIESIFEDACFVFEREQDISGEILV